MATLQHASAMGANPSPTSGTNGHNPEGMQDEDYEDVEPAADATQRQPSDLSDVPEELLRADPRVQAWMDAQAAELRRKYLGKAKKKQPPQTQTQALDSDLLAVIAQVVHEQVSPIVETVGTLSQHFTSSQFDKAFSASGLPEDFRQLASDAVKAANPSDMAGYLAKFAGKLAAPAEQVQPKRPSTPTPGSAPTAPPRDFSGLIDPSTLSAEDVAHLEAKGELLDVYKRWRNRSNPRRRVLGAPKK